MHGFISTKYFHVFLVWFYLVFYISRKHKEDAIILEQYKFFDFQNLLRFFIGYKTANEGITTPII